MGGGVVWCKYITQRGKTHTLVPGSEKFISGKCNGVPSSAQDARVYGVVLDVSSAVLRALDAAEQRCRGYERTDVIVEGPDTTFEAFVYVAQPAYVDDALLPYDWYHARVLAGAGEHDLSTSYVGQIESVPSYPDPKEKRRRKHHRLLRKAGFSQLGQ